MKISYEAYFSKLIYGTFNVTLNKKVYIIEKQALGYLRTTQTISLKTVCVVFVGGQFQLSAFCCVSKFFF